MRCRLQWQHPPFLVYKLNIDGAFRKRKGSAIAALRNWQGHGGSCRKTFVGLLDAEHTEFEGLMLGLDLISMVGLQGFVVETDCKSMALRV